MRRGPLESRECQGCHKEFLPSHSLQRYCSLECVKIADPHLYRAKIRREKRRLDRQADTTQKIKPLPGLELLIVKEIQSESSGKSENQKRSAASGDFQARTEPYGDISRDEMMALVAKRNEDARPLFEKMTRMSPVELKTAYQSLSDEEKREYEAFYMKKFEVKRIAYSTLFYQKESKLFKGRVKRSLYQRVSDAFRTGTLGYIRNGMLREEDFLPQGSL